jgi:hypothetical protein
MLQMMEWAVIELDAVRMLCCRSMEESACALLVFIWPQLLIAGLHQIISNLLMIVAVNSYNLKFSQPLTKARTQMDHAGCLTS